MPAEEITNHPENHVLASFSEHANAVAAKEALIDKGLTNCEVLRGEEAAENMNTRAQWFADTDEELRRYENKLREGYSVLAVEVHDKQMRQVVEQVLHMCHAEIVTYFGTWVIESKQA